MTTLFAPDAQPVYLRVNSTQSFAVDPAWPERRADIVWGPMSGIAVDRADNVWVLSRKNIQVIQYSPAGKVLRAWGNGFLKGPHQLRLDSHDNLWFADSGNHVVVQTTPDGKVLRTLGTPGEGACDESHFWKPTDVAVSNAGDVYIADGYGNARIVHYDKNGKYVRAWGKLGVKTGEFNLLHSVAVDSRGRVYVADRNNARVQVFEGNGTFVDQWLNIVVPCSFGMTRKDELWICGTSPMLWRDEDGMLGYPPKDQLVMKFNTAGKMLQLWSFPMGEDGKEKPGDLNWIHGLAADSKGNLFAVDVMGKRVQKFGLVPSETPAANK
jgi:DNA-binding beta-propeller fold protein YncE